MSTYCGVVWWALDVVECDGCDCVSISSGIVWWALAMLLCGATEISEIIQFITPNCSRPQPTLSNSVRNDSSNCLSVAPRTHIADVMHQHFWNARTWLRNSGQHNWSWLICTISVQPASVYNWSWFKSAERVLLHIYTTPLLKTKDASLVCYGTPKHISKSMCGICFNWSHIPIWLKRILVS